MLENNPDKLPKADDASRIVLQNYQRAYDANSERREMWEEWYKLYRSVIEITDDDLITQLVIPATFSTVEDLLPRLVANRPRIEVWGRGPEDELRAAKHRARNFFLWDSLKMSLKLIDYVKSAEIFGTAIMKTNWRQLQQQRLQRAIVQEPSTIFGIPTGRMNNRIEYALRPTMTWDDPWVEIIPIDEVHPDPDGRCVDSCKWMIHEVRTNLHELKSSLKDGNPLYDKGVLTELEKLLVSGSTQRREDSLNRMVRSDFGGGATPSADPLSKDVTILEQWEDGRVITVVKDFPQLKPLRNEFNEVGSKPFIRFTPIPDPNQFYGISIPELMSSLQVELSLLHSLNVDNLMYSVHQMFKVLQTSGINSRNLRFRPGGVVPVKDMNDIRPMERNFSDFSLYRTTDDLRRWVQKVGVTDTFSGVASDLTGRTATEATLLAEASASRAGLMFQILGQQALDELGRKWIRLDSLFLTDERSLRVLGDDFSDAQFERVSPEDLLSGTGMDLDVLIDVAATEPATRQFKLTQAKDMLATFAQAGLPQNHPVVEFILTELLRAFGKDRPELLVTAPETRAIAGQAAAETTPGQAPGGDNIASIGDALAAQFGAQQGG